MIERRMLLKGAMAASAGLFVPRLAFAAAPTDRRFVFIIQRGAADGLHAVPPLGDPGYAALRGAMIEGLTDAPKLDGTFALHPALARTAGFFAAKQALVIHAVASAYRDRSHFDGQNVLETGGVQPYAEKTGWMNRLIMQMPANEKAALALSAGMPMALRGPADVASYAPSRLPRATDDFLMRVSQLYAQDRQLDPLWQSALATNKIAGDLTADNGRNAADTGKLAASLMTPAGGARLMMIETGGWDTHSGQAGRLAAQLKGLDALVGAMADGLGPLWQDTLVIVATEFGRTAAINGTGGTDHGTGSAMLLYGGALAGGGRVLADWPGLGQGALYERRDLKPTMSTEAVIAGYVARHFGLEPAKVAQALYPAQSSLKPLTV